MHWLVVLGAVSLGVLLVALQSVQQRLQRKRDEKLLDPIPVVEFEEQSADLRQQHFDNTADLFRTGYEKYSKKGRLFRVKNVMGEWMVVIPKDKMVEIKHVANNTLSWKETIRSVMMLDYTGGPDRAAWSARALRVEITRRLADLTDQMLDGVDGFFKESFVPRDGKPHAVQIHPFMINCVARITNRIFAGEELASDPEWVETTKRFTETAWAAAAQVKVLHPLIRWPATYVLSSVRQVAKDKKYTKDRIRPLFEQRLRRMQAHDGKLPEDGFQWLLNTAVHDDGKVDLDSFADTMARIMMASIHVTAGQAAVALANLLYRPEYIPDLIEEARQNQQSGEDVLEMRKLNSFIKESMRFSPIGLTSAGRKCVVPHTFKDGTQIPRGVVLWCPLDAVCRDPDIFPDADAFDGYRFLKLRGKDKSEDKKWQLSNMNEDWLAFGYGAQSCPGRWFAEKELHLIFRKLLLDYDLEWSGPKGGEGPRGHYLERTLKPPDAYWMQAKAR